MLSQGSSYKGRRLPRIREGSATSSMVSRKSKWGKISLKSSNVAAAENNSNAQSSRVPAYFPCKIVEGIMQKAIEASSFAQNPCYNSQTCGDSIRNVSDDIKNRVKVFLHENALHRYKVVVNVVAGSAKPTDMMFASRCMWDTQKDIFVEVKLKTSEKYLTAVLYAVHHE